MAIKKKHVPGCSCCKCVLFSHNATETSFYTECSGTWVAGSQTNGLKTSSSNAKILFSNSYTGRWEAAVSVKVKSSVANEAFSLRLIGANEDPGTGFCNGTGVYCEYEGVSNGKYFRLHNGIQQPWDTTSCTSDSGITTTELTINLTLCWDGTTLTATSGAGQPNILASPISAPTGHKFGFATGTLGSNITYVEFYNFTLTKVSDDCEECAEQCCGEGTPEQLVVEIAGLSGASLEFNNNGVTCTVNDCGIFDGTYVIDASFGFSIPCGGDGSCQWNYSSFVTVLTTDQTCAGSPTAVSVRVQASISIAAGVRTISISIDTTTLFVRLTGTFTGRCSEDLTDWFNLTGTVSGSIGPGNSPFCDTTSFTTARVKIN